MRTGTEWKFGVGQTGAQEQAEIERAKREGRAEEYTAAQAEARNREHAEPKRRKRSTRTTAPPRSEPLSSPSLHGHPDSEGNALLADYHAGALRPENVAVPDGLRDGLATVAAFVALFAGLRQSIGDERPLPLGENWVASHTGLSGTTAGRALAGLVAHGFLYREGSLPPRNGRPRGTSVFGVPGAGLPEQATDEDGSDGVPVPGSEPSAVPVKAQDLVASVAVEPSAESVDETLVRDAEGGAPRLGGMLAAEGGAESVVGHGRAGYARRRSVDELMRRALQGPASAKGGSIRDDALWLACQLRDHGYDEHDEAFAALLDFASHHSRLTTSDATRILRNAYGRPPRPPAGVPGPEVVR